MGLRARAAEAGSEFSSSGRHTSMRELRYVGIFGKGGLARELAQWVGVIPEWWWRQGAHGNPPQRDGYLIGREEEDGKIALAPDDGTHRFLIGVGDPKVRWEISQRHREALRGRWLELKGSWLENTYGVGVAVLGGAKITTGITLGPHVLINLNATVGHDVVIGACSVVNPGANISGRVRIGERVLVGAGASIRQGVTVGDDAIVGMGAVVLRDVPAGETWVGNPARRLR